MTVHEWAGVLGVFLSAVLALGPWMFAVHAKLAVIASQIEQLCGRLERLSAAHEERLAMCIAHQSRLDRIEVQLADAMERVRAAE
jgi:hypothetical protein